MKQTASSRRTCAGRPWSSTTGFYASGVPSFLLVPRQLNSGTLIWKGPASGPTEARPMSAMDIHRGFETSKSCVPAATRAIERSKLPNGTAVLLSVTSTVLGRPGIGRPHAFPAHTEDKASPTRTCRRCSGNSQSGLPRSGRSFLVARELDECAHTAQGVLR